MQIKMRFKYSRSFWMAVEGSEMTTEEDAAAPIIIITVFIVMFVPCCLSCQ